MNTGMKERKKGRGGAAKLTLLLVDEGIRWWVRKLETRE
jgi:hypothetical protein